MNESNITIPCITASYTAGCRDNDGCTPSVCDVTAKPDPSPTIMAIYRCTHLHSRLSLTLSTPVHEVTEYFTECSTRSSLQGQRRSLLTGGHQRPTDRRVMSTNRKLIASPVERNEQSINVSLLPCRPIVIRNSIKTEFNTITCLQQQLT